MNFKDLKYVHKFFCMKSLENINIFLRIEKLQQKQLLKYVHIMKKRYNTTDFFKFFASNIKKKPDNIFFCQRKKHRLVYFVHYKIENLLSKVLLQLIRNKQMNFIGINLTQQTCFCFLLFNIIVLRK